jgi:hypothetical protein
VSELHNRGVEDVCIVACDGLKGLPDAITATWPKATVQTCVIHLIRASLRLAAKQHHPAVVSALRAIYTAPTEQAAEQALADFTASEMGQRYPAVVRTWRAAWSEFTPYLAFPPEIRKAVYRTKEAARENGSSQKAKQKPQPVRTVRRDGRAPMGLGAAIGALVTGRPWELPAAGATLRERSAAIAPELAGHVVAVAFRVCPSSGPDTCRTRCGPRRRRSGSGRAPLR